MGNVRDLSLEQRLVTRLRAFVFRAQVHPKLHHLECPSAPREIRRVEFLVDDVLDSHVQGAFDVVIDRGCFHTLPPDRRADYVRMVAARLAPGKHLLLKCFSLSETEIAGA